MIIRSSGKERVEVEYHVTHTAEDQITIEREIKTYPVNSHGVQWRKGNSTESEMFTIPADQVPELIKALAVGLTFPADGSTY